MNKLYIKYISGELSVKEWQVEHCVELLAQGATVPFISRYRKEQTGQLDEVQVSQVKHWFHKFEELDKRKESITKSISEQEKLTPELEKLIHGCVHLQELEDLYLPYKPKRRTKAAIAKERGLEPLALKMLTFNVPNFEQYVSSFKNNDLPDNESVL